MEFVPACQRGMIDSARVFRWESSMNRFAQSIILAATLCIAGTSVAQAQVETVVVTGSRVPEEAVGIFIVKRADHVITSVMVTCDTRDAVQRREELRSTLRNMLRAAAGTSTISLGVGDRTVDKLTEADFDDIIGSAGSKKRCQVARVIASGRAVASKRP